MTEADSSTGLSLDGPLLTGFPCGVVVSQMASHGIATRNVHRSSAPLTRSKLNLVSQRADLPPGMLRAAVLSRPHPLLRAALSLFGGRPTTKSASGADASWKD
jgi:hypothetical protein